MRLYLMMASVIVLSLAAAAGESHAQQSSKLFQASTTVTCLEDTAGFDADLQPNPLPASPAAGTTNFIRQTVGAHSNVVTFNLDGTITTQGTASNIVSPTLSTGESTSSCSGTFAVNANLSVSTATSCTFQEAGGNSGTITGVQKVYQVTPGLQLLMISAPHPPAVETVRINRPNGTSFAFQRVCAAAGSAGHLN